MNKEELLAIFDRQLRFESSDPFYERQAAPEDNPIVVRHVPLDPHLRWGWVNWSLLNATNVEQAIAEQIEFFKNRGHSFEWKRFGHDLPADLDARLLRHGFEPQARETVVVLDLEGSGFPEVSTLTRTNPSDNRIVVRRVTSAADLHKVVEIEDAVWNESHGWILDELGKELLLPGEPMLMYLACAHGVPASAAWMRFHKGTQFASLFGGSTLPEYRKRGLYTALLHVRAQAARDRGYRFLSVDASEMSRPILEKYGFVAITTATAYKYRLPGHTDED